MRRPPQVAVIWFAWLFGDLYDKNDFLMGQRILLCEWEGQYTWDPPGTGSIVWVKYGLGVRSFVFGPGSGMNPPCDRISDVTPNRLTKNTVTPMWKAFWEIVQCVAFKELLAWCRREDNPQVSTAAAIATAPSPKDCYVPGPVPGLNRYLFHSYKSLARCRDCYSCLINVEAEAQRGLLLTYQQGQMCTQVKPESQGPANTSVWLPPWYSSLLWWQGCGKCSSRRWNHCRRGRIWRG